jgi:hypothetical protein
MGGQLNNPYPFPGMYSAVYPFPTPGAASSYFSPFPPGSAMNPVVDTTKFSSNDQPKKSHGILGAIKDFGKGIFKGAVGMVKSLFTLKGLAMFLGGAALLVAAPAVAIPLFTLAGLGVGGYQMFKGITTGNWEKAGEGVFNIAATLVGAKFEPRSFTGADGHTYALTKTAGGAKVATTGYMDRLFASLKSLLPIKSSRLHKVNADGSIAADVSKSAYQLGWDSISNLPARIRSLPGIVRGWFRPRAAVPPAGGGGGEGIVV